MLLRGKILTLIIEISDWLYALLQRYILLIIKIYKFYLIGLFIVLYVSFFFLEKKKEKNKWKKREGMRKKKKPMYK
jgi:hypothetical protein